MKAIQKALSADDDLRRFAKCVLPKGTVLEIVRLTVFEGFDTAAIKLSSRPPSQDSNLKKMAATLPTASETSWYGDAILHLQNSPSVNQRPRFHLLVKSGVRLHSAVANRHIFEHCATFKSIGDTLGYRHCEMVQL